MKWIYFKDAQPSLGMTIDIKTDDGKEHNEMGKLMSMSVQGSGFGLETDSYVGVYVRGSYQWRDTSKRELQVS